MLEDPSMREMTCRNAQKTPYLSGGRSRKGRETVLSAAGAIFFGPSLAAWLWSRSRERLVRPDESPLEALVAADSTDSKAELVNQIL